MIYYVKINSYKEAVQAHKAIEERVERPLDRSHLHCEYINKKIECEAYLVHSTNETNVLCYFDSTLSPYTLQWIVEGSEVRIKPKKIKY